MQTAISDITNKTVVQEPHIESILSAYAVQIGADMAKYRNHVYRVYLHCQMLDPNPANHRAYAIAAAFHDIGIWTDHTIDYLDPSIAHAMDHLRNLGEAQMEAEVATMIYWHHKTSAYTGPFAQTTEIFRRADWTDVSLGLLRFGTTRKARRDIVKALPYEGFHPFLIRKVVANFFKHPSNPLPMFKN